MLSRYGSRILGAAGLVTMLGGCSDDNGAGTAANLPHFHDISSATPQIQTAARAVVKLHTAGQYGTGAFISRSGLMLTNNHVLGIEVCPIEGCHVEVTWLRQRGAKRTKPSIVFAVPNAIDVGLDMALIQLYDQPNGIPIDTPDFLTFEALTSVSLINQHITIVGHPEGALKKWTDGVVVEQNGEWFTSTAYTLPGDSGSPILNDTGKIVGLLHRGPNGADLFAESSATVYSVGTASAPIVEALQAPLPTTMVSVAATSSTQQFLANDLLYLNARTETISVAGLPVSTLTLLGQACDAGLARNDFTSPDALSLALSPCYHAFYWIECRTDASPVPYGVMCPAPEEAELFAQRYRAINQAWLAMNGQPEYLGISFGIGRLQPSKQQGVTAGGESLSQAIASLAPPLDIRLAYYLAAFALDSYQGVSIKDYVLGYEKIPHYELGADRLAYAATWLAVNGNLTRGELVAFSKRLLADPKINVGAELAIEDFLYDLDAL